MVTSLLRSEIILSLVPLSQQRKVKGARPIAMRESFYKLAGLYGLSLVSDELPELFEPLQLAFSRGGSERALAGRTRARRPGHYYS